MEIIIKIFQILLFTIISIVFVPMIVLVHFFIDSYSKWLEDIMKF